MAVGKMTVGYELEKITNLKLFHNHMTIELVSPFFDYSSEIGKKLVKEFRQRIFEEVSESNLEGLIFTFVWAFNEKEDWDYVKEISNIFESRGGEVCLVELEADYDERIQRNKHPERLKHKPTKKGIEGSKKRFEEYHKKFRMNSNEGEIKKKEYIRFNNTNLSPKDVAIEIKHKFNL